MTTKVEQLVMGAFWEAAVTVHRSEKLGRMTLDEVEAELALYLNRVMHQQVMKEFLRQYE